MDALGLYIIKTNLFIQEFEISSALIFSLWGLVITSMANFFFLIPCYIFFIPLIVIGVVVASIQSEIITKSIVSVYYYVQISKSIIK